jgi:hypothetical protein
MKIMAAAAVIFLGASAGFNWELTRFAEITPELKPRTLHAPMGGIEPVVADILWIRCIQFMGTNHDLSERQKIARIHRQFDLITRLDPKFYLAYRFGVLNLLVQAPERALSLVDRGLTCMSPKEYDWRLPFYGAFICYQYLEGEGRYERSLNYVRHRAGTGPTPGFVRRFEPLVLERQEEVQKALQMWERLYRRSDSVMDRRVTRHHLIRLARQVIDREVSPGLSRRAEKVLQRLNVPVSEPSDRREGVVE